MGDITTADFERVPETIPLGEAATRAHAAELARYAVPEAQYTAWRDERDRSRRTSRRGSPSVRFEGLKRVNPDYLASRDDIKAGDMVDSDRRSARRRSACRRCRTSIPWVIGSMAIPSRRRSPGCRARRTGGLTT